MAANDLQERLKELPARMVQEPWGLFVDIDGTIADIMPRPEEAKVRPVCRGALETLARRLPVVAIVTGRDMVTARRMVGLDGVTYFANHGLERWEGGALRVAPEARPYLERLHQTADTIKKRLEPLNLIIEEKGVGISIHFRTAEDPNHARMVVLDTLNSVEADQWLDVRSGKMHIDLRLPLPINKGTPVLGLAREHRLNGAVVLGDDLTDIDAFRAAGQLQERGGFTCINIAVVGDETPEAVLKETAYRLPEVAAVEGFLTWLSREVCG